MANLKINSAADLVKYFDKEPSLNPPAPRVYYNEDEDRKYLAVVTSQAEQERRHSAALNENLNPETLEPLGIDELIMRQESISTDRWTRTYGCDAIDFGNYVNFLRSN